MRGRNEMMYEITLRNKFLCTHTSTIGEFIEALEDHVALLKEMREAGVVLEADGVGDDYACFTTTDVRVAERFGMEREDLQDIIEDDLLPENPSGL
jgi:hypothetical protein